ncbi:unnamed protein product [Parnassius apollo]|uniref:(apollo) hypothetical protein n=1 Tax=Parnassius apollo TaxID=110799 RepID=A0A8S3W0G6_PARAO|nr:unnamed protein product [Parnassius apollo]
MKQLFLILALLCGAYLPYVSGNLNSGLRVSGKLKSGLRVKFSVGIRPGIDFFFPLPRTVYDAKCEGWTLTERPSGHMPSLVMYCPGERIVCTMFDQDENIAGLQIAVPKDEITDSTLDWPTQGWTKWTTTTTSGETTTFWTIQQYFVSKDTLKTIKEERFTVLERARDVLRENAVWVTAFNGELVKISKNAADIKTSIFTRQACIPGMGRHYFYNMTSETPCTSSTLFPWFAIVHSGELVATGLIAQGKLPVKSDQRDWFERPHKLVVKTIVPDGPQCLYDLVEKHGAVTMHIYYVERPWFIGCLRN